MNIYESSFRNKLVFLIKFSYLDGKEKCQKMDIILVSMNYKFEIV